MTPLIYAAYDPAPLDAVKLLVEKGADLEAKCLHWTAYQWAMAEKHYVIAQFLKEAQRRQSLAGAPAAQAPPPQQGLTAEQVAQIAAQAAAAVAGNKPAAPAQKIFNVAADTPDYKLPENPDKYAVVIGIEKYPSLPSADYAGRDAESMRRHLVALGYPPRHIKFLSNDTATRARLVAIFRRWLPRNVKPGSEVFVYYSGHGAPDPASKSAYLVTFDADVEDLPDTAYPVDLLNEELAKLPAKRVILAMDSCFSGAGGRSVLAKGARPLVTKLSGGFWSLGGAVLRLTASKSDQISQTYEAKGHGLFTYYLLKGLNGAAKKDGEVTLRTLYRYVKPHVEDEASLMNQTQAPQLFPPQADARLR